MTAAERNGARRQAILDAALRAIVAEGFEGLRLRDVAADVGINSATLVYYYPDKEELIVAVVHAIIARFRAANEERGVDPSHPGAFVEHLRAIRDALVASPELYVALCEAALRARRHPRIAAALTEIVTGWTAFVRVLLDAAVPETPARERAAAASTTASFFWGLGLRANADGRFAALLAGGDGAGAAATAIRAAVDGYEAQVRAALGIGGRPVSSRRRA